MLERRLFLQIICHIKVLVVSTVLFTSLRLLNFDTQRMYITLQLCTYILLYLLYYIYIINIIYIPFFPQNFQARRFDPTLHRAYSQLSINDSEKIYLSLIMQFTKYWSALCPKRQLQTLNMLSAVRAVLSLRHILKQWEHNIY